MAVRDRGSPGDRHLPAPARAGRAGLGGQTALSQRLRRSAYPEQAQASACLVTTLYFEGNQKQRWVGEIVLPGGRIGNRIWSCADQPHHFYHRDWQSALECAQHRLRAGT